MAFKRSGVRLPLAPPLKYFRGTQRLGHRMTPSPRSRLRLLEFCELRLGVWQGARPVGPGPVLVFDLAHRRTDDRPPPSRLVVPFSKPPMRDDNVPLPQRIAGVGLGQPLPDGETCAVGGQRLGEVA